MQTTKFLFALGAAAVLATPLHTLAGPDNEAQAKMREALRQKMEELNAPTPAPAPVAPPVVIEPAPAAPQPKPVVVETLKPVARPPTVVVPVPAEPAPVVVAPAPVKAPQVEQPAVQFSEVLDEGDAAKTIRLQEALRQKLAAEKAAISASVMVAPVAPPAPVAPAVPAKPAPPVVAPAPAPAPAPVVVAPIPAKVETAPSPLSGSKQERLAELLRRYKADEITPQEYHTQRAKIVAE